MRIDPTPDFEPVRLICRPMPIDGESWPDYVIRLAEANYIKGGLRAMAKFAGMRPSELLAGSPAEVLRRYGIRVPECRVEHRLDASMDGQYVRLELYGRSTKVRVCPLCLADDDIPYVRAEWGMPMSIACRHHKVLLIDRCQLCDEPLDVFRPYLTQCGCEAPLQGQAPLPIEPWVDELRMLFAEAYAAQKGATFERAAEIGKKAARVCIWLVASLDPETGRRPRRVLDRYGFLAISDALLMKPFLSDTFDAIVTAGLAETGHGRSRYENLNRRLGTSIFARMGGVIEAVKQRKMLVEGPIRREESRKLGKPKHGMHTFRDLAKLTGHCAVTLKKYTKLGHLPGIRIVVDAHGYEWSQIPDDLYRSIELVYRRTDSIEIAAKLIGCAKKAMCELVRSGFIRAESLFPIPCGPRDERVLPAEWQAFAKCLFATAEFEGNVSDGVRFSDWVPGNHAGTAARRWRKILDAVRNGRIRVFTGVDQPIALDELYVSRRALAELLGTRAARQLNYVSRPTQPISR